jgi:hypothetical protein
VKTLTLVAYFAAGVTFVGIRVWFAGKHRLVHGGSRGSGCDHYACDLMFWEILLPTLLFWPVVVPIQLVYWLLRKLIRAPYLRSLPPIGSASSKEDFERELIDAALGLGSVEHFTGTSEYDEKWNRMDRALKAMMAFRAKSGG